jgi:hypothetical protein
MKYQCDVPRKLDFGIKFMEYGMNGIRSACYYYSFPIIEYSMAVTPVSSVTVELFILYSERRFSTNRACTKTVKYLIPR